MSNYQSELSAIGNNFLPNGVSKTEFKHKLKNTPITPIMSASLAYTDEFISDVKKAQRTNDPTTKTNLYDKARESLKKALLYSDMASKNSKPIDHAFCKEAGFINLRPPGKSKYDTKAIPRTAVSNPGYIRSFLANPNPKKLNNQELDTLASKANGLILSLQKQDSETILPSWDTVVALDKIHETIELLKQENPRTNKAMGEPIDTVSFLVNQVNIWGSQYHHTASPKQSCQTTSTSEYLKSEWSKDKPITRVGGLDYAISETKLPDYKQIIASAQKYIKEQQYDSKISWRHIGDLQTILDVFNYDKLCEKLKRPTLHTITTVLSNQESHLTTKEALDLRNNKSEEKPLIQPKTVEQQYKAAEFFEEIVNQQKEITAPETTPPQILEIVNNAVNSSKEASEQAEQLAKEVIKQAISNNPDSTENLEKNQSKIMASLSKFFQRIIKSSNQTVQELAQNPRLQKATKMLIEHLAKNAAGISPQIEALTELVEQLYEAGIDRNNHSLHPLMELILSEIESAIPESDRERNPDAVNTLMASLLAIMTEQSSNNANGALGIVQKIKENHEYLGKAGVKGALGNLIDNKDTGITLAKEYSANKTIPSGSYIKLHDGSQALIKSQEDGSKYTAIINKNGDSSPLTEIVIDGNEIASVYEQPKPEPRQIDNAQEALKIFDRPKYQKLCNTIVNLVGGNTAFVTRLAAVFLMPDSWQKNLGL